MRHFPLQLKLNTDESPNVATEYGIRSIPTVMIFKNGGRRARARGCVAAGPRLVALQRLLGRCCCRP